MKAKKIFSSSHSVKTTLGFAEKEEVIDGHLWLMTVVLTPHGFVITHGNTKFNETSLQFVHEGRSHYRQINRFYRPLYLVTVAKRFVNEVLAQQKGINP